MAASQLFFIDGVVKIALKPLKTLGPVVMCPNGAVASDHHLASLAGLKALLSGGNAFDAAVATSAVLCVVKPQMCGLGGDAFILTYDSQSRKVRAVNSGGRAPNDLSVGVFRDRGYRVIPEGGVLAAGVPGLVRAWMVLTQKYCTKSLGELLGDAVFYAKNGFPVYANLFYNIAYSKEKLAECISSAKLYLPGGSLPPIGSLLIQRDLASTLNSLANNGLESFYDGEIAQEIDKYCAKEGGFISADDLSSYHADSLEPISTKYKGYTVYEQPPMSQGYLLLQMLKIIEPFEIARLDPVEYIHLMVEAKKLAFEERLKSFGDPDFVNLDVARLISEDESKILRQRINPDKARESFLGDTVPASGSDTTYFCVVDSSRSCVSFIQSIFSVFGSGFTVEGTGIVLNDRMMSFSLEPGHPNALMPGKRPAHTLNTYMVFQDGRPCLVGGTPGADDQVQANLQILCNILDFQFDVQEAIEAPRWSSRPGTLPVDKDVPYKLTLENRFPEEIVKGLRGKGHQLELIDPWSIGGSQVCCINYDKNTISAGADPRRDGFSVGY